MMFYLTTFIFFQATVFTACKLLAGRLFSASKLQKWQIYFFLNQNQKSNHFNARFFIGFSLLFSLKKNELFCSFIMVKINQYLPFYLKGGGRNACAFCLMCLAALHKLVICLLTSLLKKTWLGCTYLFIHLIYAATTHLQSQV